MWHQSPTKESRRTVLTDFTCDCLIRSFSFSVAVRIVPGIFAAPSLRPSVYREAIQRYRQTTGSVSHVRPRCEYCSRPLTALKIHAPKSPPHPGGFFLFIDALVRRLTSFSRCVSDRNGENYHGCSSPLFNLVCPLFSSTSRGRGGALSCRSRCTILAIPAHFFYFVTPWKLPLANRMLF